MYIDVKPDIEMIPSFKITLSKNDLAELISEGEFKIMLDRKGTISKTCNDLGDVIRYWEIKLEKDTPTA